MPAVANMTCPAVPGLTLPGLTLPGTWKLTYIKDHCVRHLSQRGLSLIGLGLGNCGSKSHCKHWKLSCLLSPESPWWYIPSKAFPLCLQPLTAKQMISLKLGTGPVTDLRIINMEPWPLKGTEIKQNRGSAELQRVAESDRNAFTPHKLRIWTKDGGLGC